MASMTSMRDVVTTVKSHLHRNEVVKSNVATERCQSISSIYFGTDGVLTPESEFMSIQSRQRHRNIGLGRLDSHVKKPSFALRVLVQERFAEIIASEIAGYQTRVKIEDNTLSVTIDTLKSTAEKWTVPRRARKAFRAAAFEALYFVGEHGLITRGADALYDLTPLEFHGLFGPLLAAMGDAEAMEGWLERTNVLAEVDLRRDSARPQLKDSATSSATRTLAMGGEAAAHTSAVRPMATQREKMERSVDGHLQSAGHVVSTKTFRKKHERKSFSSKSVTRQLS